MADQGKAANLECHCRATLHWKDKFLALLGETSDVNKSAKLASVSPARIFEARREEKGFSDEWDRALKEGYASLEMELLRRLREGDFTTLSDAKYDFTNAVRLLSSYREFHAKHRPERSTVSSAEIRAAIDAKIKDLRLQVMREKLRTAKGEE